MLYARTTLVIYKPPPLQLDQLSDDVLLRVARFAGLQGTSALSRCSLSLNALTLRKLAGWAARAQRAARKQTLESWWLPGCAHIVNGEEVGTRFECAACAFDVISPHVQEALECADVREMMWHTFFSHSSDHWSLAKDLACDATIGNAVLERYRAAGALGWWRRTCAPARIS